MPIVTHETVVMEVPPWANRTTACKLFGLSKRRLHRLREDGIIRAKKVDDKGATSFLYRTADVIDWLEN